MTSEPEILGVRRWGETDTTPVVLDRRARPSDCTRDGCLGLAVRFGGIYRLVHLTTGDALRLSDLLRAMADTNPEGPAWPNPQA